MTQSHTGTDAESQIPITAGPSIFDLLVSLAHGSSGRERHFVEFDALVRMSGEEYERLRRPCISAVINRLERLDGSGENWSFKGWYKTYIGDFKAIYGKYSTQTRQGWFKEITECPDCHEKVPTGHRCERCGTEL